MLKALVATAVAALAIAGLALAAPQKDTYNLTANLRARSEVPRPTGVPVGATGLFTGKVVELANDKAKLTWRLTFSKLSGAAGAAHIHAGKPGKAGPVMIALCGPCKSGQMGVTKISKAVVATLEKNGAYVNVHTAKNAAGEIRGQVKASEVG